ncbi:MAG: EamA family transporter [candidate division NC10 bacterium]|nr:EamA family transporter [candidate division NC10 bacterium]MBI2113631.1 EamA family transporter [candidate division NC10 bacterium]
MWLVSLGLILLSAGLHASWNLIVKGEEDKLVSAWLIVVAPPLVLSPLLFFTGLPASRAWPILLQSGTIQAAYVAALVRAYEHGDLSVVYPVARGLAPLFVALGAPMVLGESLSPLAVAAVALVGGGIAWLGLAARGLAARIPALGWATATAALIATYSIVDKVGVMRSNPVAYIISLWVCIAAILLPYVLRYRSPRQIRNAWKRRWGILLASGLFSIGAYLLILFAMRLTQVSYIAALRESSVIFGAFLGWRVLGEPFGRQRVSAAAVVTLGLILLALAMRG